MDGASTGATRSGIVPVTPRTTPPETAEEAEAELAPEDFYLDGPFVVFTAAFHLKRGYCCNSGCRHCPFR